MNTVPKPPEAAPMNTSPNHSVAEAMALDPPGISVPVAALFQQL